MKSDLMAGPEKRRGSQRWGVKQWRRKVKCGKKRPPVILAVAMMLLLTACGYHSVEQSSALAPNIRTIAIPAFHSQSRTFRIEQQLTDAVVKEFNTRTQFRIVHDNEEADAVLKGTVLSASTAPLAYDSQTGRAASALITLNVSITLTDSKGKIIFQNPSYLFHDQYELTRDLNSFFEEETPAIDRMSRDFAHTLVANILEAY
jgi:outer membrane lipopolysaccharide assembly protein LptE/RlpB